MLTVLKRILKMCGHALSITIHERLDIMEQRSAETDNALLQAAIRMAERIPQGATHAVVDGNGMATGQPVSDPWVHLIVYLYSHLQSRKAALIGTPWIEGSGSPAASVLAILERAGYEMLVCSQEAPAPEDLGVLIADPATRMAHVIPSRPPAVAITRAEDGLDQLVGEMRARGYHWYLVVWRESISDGAADRRASFYANYPALVPGVEGRVFFFCERETFVEAQSWCAALLKRTYFRFLAT